MGEANARTVRCFRSELFDGTAARCCIAGYPGVGRGQGKIRHKDGPSGGGSKVRDRKSTAGREARVEKERRGGSKAAGCTRAGRELCDVRCSEPPDSLWQL